MREEKMKELKKEFLVHLKDFRGISDSSLRQYNSVLTQFIDDARGFSKAKVKRWLQGIQTQKPSTIQNKITIVKMFLEFLKIQKVIKENWLKNARAPHSQKLPKFLSIPEFKEKASQMNTYYQTLAYFLISTGLRISEWKNLTLNDISFDGDYAILKIRGKGNKERLLRVHRILIDKGIEAGIFTNKKTVRAVQKYFRKRGINPHLLRHTFAKRFLEQGGKLNALQAIMGHESILTTSIYIKVLSENITIPFDY